MTDRITIVALGDSTTAGTPAFRSPIESPPTGSGDEQSQYAYWLMRTHPEWDVRNRGVNGERTDEIATRFDRDVLGAAPTVVIVIGGVNDIYQGRSAEAVERQLASIYERAAAARIKVVAGTIIPFNTATADQNRRMHQVNDWILSRPAHDPNLSAVDTRRAAAANDHPDRLISSPDDLHPSTDGYRRMADAIRPVLERMTRF
ncbi:MAG: SGNH/GDSL hydrolase family protein [Vicinamibacterales bacterium]